MDSIPFSVSIDRIPELGAYGKPIKSLEDLTDYFRTTLSNDESLNNIKQQTLAIIIDTHSILLTSMLQHPDNSYVLYLPSLPNSSIILKALITNFTITAHNAAGIQISLEGTYTVLNRDAYTKELQNF